MRNPQDKNSDLAFFSILNLIKEYGSLPQVRLSELSGYSPSTVSINCDKLLSRGYIVSDSSSTSNKRKNIELRLNRDLGYVIGIAIGETTCRIGLFDLIGTLIKIIRAPVEFERGPELLIEFICLKINEILSGKEENKPLLGIGMGLPSPVQYEEGVAFHPAYMPGWHLFPVKDMLSRRYHCPVFVDNEVKTMALGEYSEMKDRSIKNLLCIKTGIGIGAGIIANGNIYRGENGGGGNIGHMRVDNDTTPCFCGKCGCIEAIASAPAIEKKAEKIINSHPGSFLSGLYKERHAITITDIKQAADHGDPDSLRLIREAGTTLGSLIGKLIIFFDPGMVIIAGRLTNLGLIYLDSIRKAAINEAMPWISAGFTIEFSKLSADCSATGAALLCTNELFNKRLIRPNS
jgi:predicted NBD/HSP70 family sugar kinase